MGGPGKLAGSSDPQGQGECRNVRWVVRSEFQWGHTLNRLTSQASSRLQGSAAAEAMARHDDPDGLRLSGILDSQS